LACYLPDAVITDSRYIQSYYRRKFGKETSYLPYGYEPRPGKDKGLLKSFGLAAGKYLVWVGRLVPDNHTDELLGAFKGVRAPLKCVVIGDDRLEGSFKRKIVRMGAADPRVVFTGFLERGKYSALVKNAFLYVETKRSGGTHPSLVEAMGFGTLVVSNDHPGAKEVLGKGAVFYKKGSIPSLTRALEGALSLSRGERGRIKKGALGIVRDKYSWGKIIKGYERLFLDLTESPRRQSPGN
jgi:glycosyltransferase involved in cell wall biosynthesis